MNKLNMARVAVFAAAAIGAPMTAQAQTAGNLIFQGESFVTAIDTPAQCNPKGVATSAEVIGDFDRVVYRFKPPNTNNDADSLAFIGARNANRIVSTTASGSLNGPASVTVDGLNSKASLFTGVVSKSNLRIVPVPPATTISAATNIEITGTVDDYFDIAGCNVSIRAVLTIRPPGT